MVRMGTARFCVTGPAASALGRATFTPSRAAFSASTTAVVVTMKMISSTRNTSVSGVMLISATTASGASASPYSCTPAPLSSRLTFIPTMALPSSRDQTVDLSAGGPAGTSPLFDSATARRAATI